MEQYCWLFDNEYWGGNREKIQTTTKEQLLEAAKNHNVIFETNDSIRRTWKIITDKETDLATIKYLTQAIKNLECLLTIKDALQFISDIYHKNRKGVQKYLNNVTTECDSTFAKVFQDLRVYLKNPDNSPPRTQLDVAKNVFVNSCPDKTRLQKSLHNARTLLNARRQDLLCSELSL